MKPALTLSIKCIKKVHEAVKLFKKSNPYHQQVRFTLLIGNCYKKCSNEIFMPTIWFTLWSSRSQVYVGIFIPDASIKMGN